MRTQKRKEGHEWVRMVHVSVTGTKGTGGTQQRGKGRHRWSRRGMYDGQWPGKIPQNTIIHRDDTYGHGWAWMITNGAAWVLMSTSWCVNTKRRQWGSRMGADVHVQVWEWQAKIMSGTGWRTSGTEAKGGDSGELRGTERIPWHHRKVRRANARKKTRKSRNNQTKPVQQNNSKNRKISILSNNQKQQQKRQHPHSKRSHKQVMVLP